MTLIRLREHEAIRVGPQPDDLGRCITLNQARLIARTCRRTEALRFTSDAELRAKEIVGVIVAGDVQVEILPKIDGLDEGGTRLNLVRILHEAGWLPFDAQDVSAIDWQRTDLLDAFMRMFLLRLEREARHGLSHRYLGLEEDISRLRGRLDVRGQYTRNLMRPQLLACRYDEFSPDHWLNRALKCALALVASHARYSETKRRALSSLILFDGVSDVRAEQLQWSNITIDRTNARFRPLIELAKLLLGGLRQTTSSGERTGFALLFDMNILFERYVGSHMRRLFGRDVRLQGPLNYALQEIETERNAFQTKPDVFVQHEVLTIVDTKWKRLDAADANLGVRQSDVYQMIAYAQVYGATRLILLYPLHSGLRQTSLPRRYAVANCEIEMNVAAIPLDELGSVPEFLRSVVAGKASVAT